MFPRELIEMFSQNIRGYKQKERYAYPIQTNYAHKKAEQVQQTTEQQIRSLQLNTVSLLADVNLILPETSAKVSRVCTRS